MAEATGIIEKVKAAGVVGAGGAGFPTHLKLASQVAVVIANGAECEPLVHVDQELMIEQAPLVAAGMRAAIQASERAARGHRDQATLQPGRCDDARGIAPG